MNKICNGVVEYVQVRNEKNEIKLSKSDFLKFIPFNNNNVYTLHKNRILFVEKGDKNSSF